MAVETNDDRTALLADFGVSATYTPTGGSASTITGIFDNDVQEVDAGGTATSRLRSLDFFVEHSTLQRRLKVTRSSSMLSLILFCRSFEMGKA